MNIAVVGMGFVGSVTAAVLAAQGHNVTGLDIDREKIIKFRSGDIPIYEPELKDYIMKSKKNLEFTAEYSVLKDSEVIFIAVPTPNINGKIDLKYVYDAVGAASTINRNAIIVIKSTVVPGTGSKVEMDFNIRVVSNPEFLREGNAIQDTVHPDRIIIGGEESATKTVANIWKFTNSPALITTRENAELIKYASNSFLATKISFINEIANICEKIPNADVEIIAKGMGYDKRIGPLFLRAGIGYGGSCFPKDTEALISFAEERGEEMKIVKSAKKVNDERINRIISIIEKGFNRIEGLNILQLGISFKENTNDVRESQGLKLYEALVKKGARVYVYDPVTSIKGINYCSPLEECVKGKDIVVVAAGWLEFKKLENMGIEIPVIDGRRILSPEKFGNYIGIGRHKSG